MKPQAVRLLDVFVLGPGMIWSASLIPGRHRYARGFLVLTGVATIAYNWQNWKLASGRGQPNDPPSKHA